MKLFAAGPEPAELQRCAEDGLCAGVVVLGPGAMDTAPEARERLATLGRAFAGPILVEVAAVDDAASLGRVLAALGPQFAARVPFAAGGAATFAACKTASVKTNAFGCATTEDAVAAGRAGAAWVSPTLSAPIPGLASDADHDAFRKTRGLLKAFDLATQLLVGPLRDANGVLEATLMGAHATLVTPTVLRALAARRA
jgi:hypothetical protein